jgi:hypothetical protein
MSHMSAEERDKMLEDLVKGSIGELNDNLIHEKVRLENHIDQEKTKFIQQLIHRFNQEIRQLKRCLKNRNYSDAYTLDLLLLRLILLSHLLADLQIHHNQVR